MRADAAERSGDGADLAVPLAELAVGESARIVEISAETPLARRCLALGLRAGAEITVSHRRGEGVIVANHGNRVALGAEMAGRLLVERIR